MAVIALVRVIVILQDEEVELFIEDHLTVGDLIRNALSAFDIRERISKCHLEGDERFFFHYEHIKDLAGGGEVFLLRLPV